MKKTILFLFLLNLVLFSCSKEKTPTTIGGKTILKNNLTVDDLISFLPKSYFDETSKIVFKDDFNNEKKFSVSSFEGSKNSFETNTIKYTFDAFRIELTPDDNSDFFLRISGSASYNEQENIQSNNLDYMLIKKGDHFGDGLILEFKEGKYVSNGFSAVTSPFTQRDRTYPTAYHSNYEINRFTTTFPFSDILITSESGIMSFNDLNGTRWFFDRVLK